MTSSSSPLITEIAWEVCNQVGGIYTVVRSKASAMRDYAGNRYAMIGPYFADEASAAFELIKPGKEDIFCKAAAKLDEEGIPAVAGTWLVTGKPRCILLDFRGVHDQLDKIKYFLWEEHQISSPAGDTLIDDVLAFGYCVRRYLTVLAELAQEEKLSLTSVFHEWMASSGMAGLYRDQVPLKSVFITHATLLGRYLAMNDPGFYKHMPFYDWKKEAKHFGIDTQVTIERLAATYCDVLGTVSEVTARECKYLLGRKADVIVPNGLNIQRFEALHEVQNLHQEFKEEIHQFVLGHFFRSYTFDLDKTLYFFTSGRFEYKNKGFDLTLEALRRLNKKLIREKSDTTIVMFFITRKPFHSISAESLEARGVMEEVRQTTDKIVKQIEQKLFFATVANRDPHFPSLNGFVDEYWKLRLRRTLQSWRSNEAPAILTHNLVDEEQDQIMQYIREHGLCNAEEDRVKIIYHPDFISPTNPLFGIEYGQFVRGCHLGVFPSYYEPWGYTPLESIALGVPTITSDLAGFGEYVRQRIADHDENGIYVLQRHETEEEDATDQLTDQLYAFTKMNRRERISLRNRAEDSAENFDWKKLVKFYEKAITMATDKK